MANKEKEKKLYDLAPLPGKVRIGLIEYDVELKPCKDISGKQDLQGRAQSTECLIEVGSDMPIQRQVETYVHEVLHMILYEAGLDSDDNGDVHRRLNPLCNILTRMLQENDFGWIYREHQGGYRNQRVNPELERMKKLL